MGNKRWSEGEKYTLIEIIGGNFREYTTGVNTKFYASASTSLKTKTATQVKSKCIELESAYKDYKAKLSRSGFGVKESDPSSIKELLAKKCKYFYQMDEIFGAQHNIVPPVIMEPGRTEFNLQGGTERSASSSSSVSYKAGTQELKAASTSKDADGTPGSTSKVESLRSPPPVARMLDRLREDRERESAKRHKADMEYRERELALKQEHFALYKEELRLKEKKMDQQFKLLSQQIALQHKQLELELAEHS
ncbi:hypothetical protein PR002_g29424 [Phytophthora rubi]|uniref:Myb/SANT-like domain-containing protein n=1 Tax=Phytophthora rubi TaxID=129364 RepID=A0A6A3H1R8_9STRA|nr:hypothetical protein PR002_g29424 [Phytophthora rubi]